MKRDETKATAISPAVYAKVIERDGGRCVLCMRSSRLQCAHYIARSHGGLGIEQNLVMLCEDCHRLFDQSAYRKEIREELRNYLTGCYPDFDERALVYRKYKGAAL